MNSSTTMNSTTTTTTTRRNLHRQTGTYTGQQAPTPAPAPSCPPCQYCGVIGHFPMCSIRDVNGIIEAEQDEDIKRVLTEYMLWLSKNKERFCHTSLDSFFHENYGITVPSEVELVLTVCPQKRANCENRIAYKARTSAPVPEPEPAPAPVEKKGKGKGKKLSLDAFQRLGEEAEEQPQPVYRVVNEVRPTSQPVHTGIRTGKGHRGQYQAETRRKKQDRYDDSMEAMSSVFGGKGDQGSCWGLDLNTQ